jgi:hypothetical protein
VLCHSCLLHAVDTPPPYLPLSACKYLQELKPPSPLKGLQEHLIYRVSRAEADLKDGDSAPTLEEEHDAHMMEMQRLLKEEQEKSAALVDSAIDGVTASYGEIYEDDEWPGAGRWEAPEPVKTDVYEWPVKPGSDFRALDLALGRRRR